MTKNDMIDTLVSMGMTHRNNAIGTTDNTVAFETTNGDTYNNAQQWLMGNGYVIANVTYIKQIDVCEISFRKNNNNVVIHNIKQ